ncbi:MAG: hypothetical protein ACK5B9_04040 [Flavobacteriia bacterium]|jgi:DNA adenine methylase
MNFNFNQQTIYEYVEFSFCLPINDLFYEKWDDDFLKADGKEIFFVSNTLGIILDKEKIENNYWEETNNVEVFHSSQDIETFIYFDLIRDSYDQCDMVFLGVRCNKKFDNLVRGKLLELYSKRNPRSNFQIDYFNQTLYRNTFNSDFYFYKLDKNKNRSIFNHNLH